MRSLGPVSLNPMTRIFSACAIAGLLCALPAFEAAAAGEFSVNPIRLELGAAARSGVIVVKNEGKGKLSFQLSAMEWTQDDSGKDQYADTRDLIFFPKIMTIDPGQDGVIRVGIKNAALPTEKTYRLFIEELPAVVKSPDGSGVQINVLIRFGAPIFVGPLKPKDGLEIDNLTLARGTASFSARNVGNRHQVAQGIHLRGADAGGKEIYALTIADRYLLAGTNKPYTASIAADLCSKLASLEVEVKTDKATAARKLAVTSAMCP